MVINSIVETVLPGTLPDGRYEAVWHGYQITWKIDCRELKAHVKDGVRGWVNGFMVIENGEMKFEQ